jgi:hypothetical protein
MNEGVAHTRIRVRQEKVQKRPETAKNIAVSVNTLGNNPVGLTGVFFGGLMSVKGQRRTGRRVQRRNSPKSGKVSS